MKLKKLQSLATTHIHFIGIGGIGMSAIAMILSKSGYSISGSDSKKSTILDDLSANKINIFENQEADNIDKIIETYNKKKKIIVVISSAINKQNEELNKAKKYNLSVKHRSEILAMLIEQHKSIVVSGSHGKTTTSTYITTILSLANKSHTAVIGGIVPLYKKNYNISNSQVLIAEADESDGSLVNFNPQIGIITNIELEHVDHYENINNLIETMQIFAGNCKYLIGNADCQNVKKNIDASSWYSTKTSKNIDYALIPKESNGCEIISEYYEKSLFVDSIRIPIPGIHNLSNTIAAISACREAGLSFNSIQKGIENLQLPERRFEYKGLWKNRLIVDDYAHHPSEVDAAITMAYLMIKTKNKIFPFSPNRLVTIFQPHRFSRTKKFEINFAYSLIESNLVFITPIYSAGETKIDGINHKSLAKNIKKLKPSIEIYAPNNNKELMKLIKEKTKEKDLILTMGAGNINMIWKQLCIESIKTKSINCDLVA